MEKINSWEELGEALANKHLELKNEQENISLGMEIEKLRNGYFYGKIIKFLKGDDSENGSMYFHELKPLYDKYGYEKVNRVLLAFEDEKGGKKDE
jgi:hypothetical protein